MNKQKSTFLFYLSFVWAFILFLLGAWWLYFISNIEKYSRDLPIEEYNLKVATMIKWEGTSFVILLIFLSLTIIGLYLKDRRVTKSMQDFFSTITHELKTPLASIRLQAEVMHEVIQDQELLKTKTGERLHQLADRLIEDTINLETQMDKVLQLSRIERGGELNLVEVDLVRFVQNLAKKLAHDFEISINHHASSSRILADEFALELIFKNLIENTKKHTDFKKVQIELSDAGPLIRLRYRDHGRFFGDIKKIKEIFYKHNSSKGSGIGLYLIDKLMQKMHGNFSIELEQQEIIFDLLFKRGTDDAT